MRHNLSNAFHRKPTDPLFTHFKANLARFSAHKASYVHRVVENELNSPADGSGVSPQQKAAARLRMFDQFQRTERNTAIARARTAVQFERFNQPDELRLFPNLRWLPSRSAEPRPTHMQFYNRVWAKDDPFWNSNCPGTEWNCKCDLEQTNDPPTENANIHTPAPPLGLEGNPYHTHQLFTDRVSYIRHNTRLHGAKKAERMAQRLAINSAAAAAKASLQDKNASCNIEGEAHEVMLSSRGIAHCARDMEGNVLFWVKNELLQTIDAQFKNAIYVGKKASDSSHNKKARTKRLKEQTDFFHYFSLALPNGEHIYLHIGHYRSNLQNPQLSDRYYLYSITKNIPKNMETL